MQTIIEEAKVVLSHLKERQLHFEGIDFPITAKAFKEGADMMEKLISIIEGIESVPKESNEHSILPISNASEIPASTDEGN